MYYTLEINFSPAGAPRYEHIVYVDADNIEDLAKKIIEIREQYVDSYGYDFYENQAGCMSILDSEGDWLEDVENQVRAAIREVRGGRFWL